MDCTASASKPLSALANHFNTFPHPAAPQSHPSSVVQNRHPPTPGPSLIQAEFDEWLHNSDTPSASSRRTADPDPDDSVSAEWSNEAFTARLATQLAPAPALPSSRVIITEFLSLQPPPPVGPPTEGIVDAESAYWEGTNGVRTEWDWAKVFAEEEAARGSEGEGEGERMAERVEWSQRRLKLIFGHLGSQGGEKAGGDAA
ncbi:hypothetical protein BDK51DRAFT_39389 [Blyttiomyces helicus]|uniref:Uncharacterized protein n=1 Tax=Blyttiomyces helicus TaxID=388810 RepID=A0A4P9VXZ5_9FUNG|nr:hypothetical protein BDK51DRAFT_39389 [Blyttiomyces helicus]|eukprot:RKO83815.1 hypothetical protein BDK51DRAFT_39389 [Blyttiomyces helicus]